MKEKVTFKDISLPLKISVIISYTIGIIYLLSIIVVLISAFIGI